MSKTADVLPQEDNLQRSLWFSLGAHVVLIIFFSVKVVFFSGENLNYERAVRVDLVALPDKISAPPAPEPSPAPEPTKPIEPAKAEPAKTEPAKVPKADPKGGEISLKEKQRNALNRLKAMAAVDKIKQEVQKDSKPTGKPEKFKGNILSPGSELTGVNKLQHEEYISALDRHIKEHWTLPEWLAKKDYTAQVRVRIDEDGEILGKQLVKSSGNPTYDDIVLATVDQAAPFPVPPEKFAAIVSVNGILIGFPE